MEFANKEYFLLLLLLIPYLIWYVGYRKKSEPTIQLSDTYAYLKAPKSWRMRMMPPQRVSTSCWQWTFPHRCWPKT